MAVATRLAGTSTDERLRTLVIPGQHDVDRVSDGTIAVCRAVLVDERSVHACVPHPPHQLASTGPRHRSEVVAGMTQIVDVDARQPCTIKSACPHRREGSVQLRR